MFGYMARQSWTAAPVFAEPLSARTKERMTCARSRSAEVTPGVRLLGTSGASKSSPSSRELADWLGKDGQVLIPVVELVEKDDRVIEEVIDVMGRATIEAVLQMSPEPVAGPKQQQRRDSDREVYCHGGEAGRVPLKERQLRVDKPGPRAGEPGGGGDFGVYGVGAGPASGGSDGGAGAARRVDAQVRSGAAGDGRPGGRQQVGSLSGDPRRGDARSEGVGRTGPERAGRCW